MANYLLSKKLCGCANILPHMEALFFWPEGSNTIERSSEAVLLLKTFEEKFEEIQKEIEKMHTYETPCIMGLPAVRVSSRYERWLKKEMGMEK